MNDERYVLARVKAQLLQMLSEKDQYLWKSEIVHKVLDLIVAVEVTAVLDMDVEDLLRKEQEDKE